MSTALKNFKDYLNNDKKMAENSVMAYLRDLGEFEKALAVRGVADIAETSESDIAAYLLALKQEDKTAATVNRKLASIRAFCKYACGRGLMGADPSLHIKSPKIARKEVEYLTIEEVETLLAQPDDSVRGMRDRAILELLYAAGIRVSEAVEAAVADINLRMGFISCNGEHGKARIIPLGRPSRAALEAYIYDARGALLREKEENGALFLNYYGERLTRQALWKIINGYAQAAGIKHKITPQILRNSFAVHMIQNGADLKSLQELLGHEDPAATQIYLMVTKNKIKDVYDKTHPRA
jgi:integrase/recombinase XerD